MNTAIKYMRYNIVEITEAMRYNGYTDDEIMQVLASLPKKRTNKQNASIHLYCTQLANLLNEQGQTFSYTGIKGIVIELPFTMDLVKNFTWKPIQLALFSKKSTTQLNRSEIDKIYIAINNFISTKFGIYLPFPSIENE